MSAPHPQGPVRSGGRGRRRDDRGRGAAAVLAHLLAPRGPGRGRRRLWVLGVGGPGVPPHPVLVAGVARGRRHPAARAPVAAVITADAEWSAGARAGAIGLAVLFALLAGTVAARHGAPLGPDLPLHRWALQHRQHAVTAAAVALTRTGTGVPAYLVAAVAGAAGRRHSPTWWQGAALAAGALAAGQLVRLGLVELVGRRRPPLTDWAVSAAGPALPSGHTTSAALVAALVCLAVRRGTDQKGRRVGVCAAAVLWALAVGGTRVYLGVHWPTDVLAGWLLAGSLTCAVLSWPRTRARLGGGAPLLPIPGPGT